jgi:hypothetical protein
VGHLLLGMRDAKSGRVIWSARFSARVTARPDDLDVMRKGVAKIFESFPRIDSPAASDKPLPLPGGERREP